MDFKIASVSFAELSLAFDCQLACPEMRHLTNSGGESLKAQCARSDCLYLLLHLHSFHSNALLCDMAS